jgi:hypothetical protein
MRLLVAWVMALGVAAMPAMAGTDRAGDGGNKDTSTPAKADTTASKDKPADATAESKPNAPAKPASAVENELQQLRQLLEAQSRQLQAQSEQLKQQQDKMQAMEAELKTVSTPAASGLASSGAAAANSPSASGPSATGSLASGDGDGQEKEGEGPSSLRIKGITITPGGFLAAESVFRNKAIVNDINTNFKNVPFPGTSGSQTTELNFTARQSRLSLLAEGKLADVKLTGYVETDFLGAGVTSNNNESNSYLLRFRQMYGQAAFSNGWTITGGQMWSLVTETRKGLDNRTEASPVVIDPQYTAGFSWARQYGFRVTKNFGNKLWLGLSVENPELLFGGKIQTQNTLVAAPGDTGGLLNNQANYSYNQTPDFIIKGAWEPGFGHYELFGIVSTFRTRIFPCAGSSVAKPCAILGPNGETITSATSAVGAFNDTITGGGFGGNARFPFFNKKVELALHGLYGYGVGRYGTSTLADVTVHPDGTLVGLHNGQALVTIELHPTPAFDIVFYGGGEYAGRAAYVNGSGAGVGYGSPLLNNFGCFAEISPTNQNTPVAPGNCQGDIRADLEGTVQFWHRLYSGPRGRFQWGLQYSYFQRSSWVACGSNLTPAVPCSGSVNGVTLVTNGQPKGIDNMFFTSVRYYLP